MGGIPASPSRQERLAAFAILAIAVGIGATGLAIAGAPHSYGIVNGAALLFALIAVSAPPLESRAFPLWVLIIGATLLVATLIIGPNVDGVRRWIAVGPITLHVGMLMLPAMGAAMMLQPPRIALGFGVIVSAAACLQPDFATALALFLAVLPRLANANRTPADYALILASGTAMIVTLLRGNPLPSVRYVETALSDVWQVAPFLSVMMGIALIAAITVPPWIITRQRPGMRWAAYGSIGALTGYAIASFTGAYPQPLIGYGASSIVGCALALAVLIQSAPVSDDQEFIA